MSKFDGKLVFTEFTVTGSREETEEERVEREAQPPYWEDEDIVDGTFEEVEEAVQWYLTSLERDGVEEPNISFAPLSPKRWELVGFHPEYASAILDSVYTVPAVAEAIMEAYPAVGKMEF